MAYALIEASIWTPRDAWRLLWIGLAAVVILFFTLRGRRSARELGLAAPSLSAIPSILAGGLVLCAGVVVVAALVGRGSAATPAPGVSRVWQYAVWAVLQQFLLQSFFYVRLESLLGSRGAVAATAALFASAHVPNPVLTVATLVGGLFFCGMFRRYRSILPLGILHALLGLTIAACFSDATLHHMRVGIGYLNYP